MSEVQHRHEPETPWLARRSFLIGAGAILAAQLTGCEKKNQNDILPDREVLVRLPQVEQGPLYSDSLERINTAYLSELLSGLQAEAKSPEAKVRAVQQSLRRIKGPTIEATAFEIDESGYYLTVEHAIRGDYKSEAPIIINPYTGERSLVAEVRAHDKADMAIIYAPNGRPPKPTRNLQFDFSALTDEQRLWLIGLYPSKKQELLRCIKPGRVDRSVELAGFNVEQASRVAVKGIIPFGGTSGSPIVDGSGTVVAVEAGAFPDDAKSTDAYQGAVVTPLAYARQLVD